jgi:localization factor PodJL
MKSAAWRVRGIGHEARETAREAARRAGMSLGQWLNAVIAESAGDVKGEGREEDLAVIHERLDDLILRLKEIARSGTEDAPHAEPRARDVSSEASLQALERRLAELAQALSRRRKQGPNRVADAVGRLNERLDQLIAEGEAFEQRLGEVREEGSDASGGRPSADRRELPPRLAGLERRVRELTQEIEALRRGARFDQLISALRGDLADIKRSLAAAQPRCALEALRSEVDSLAARVDDNRRRGAPDGALSAIERSLAAVCDALAALVPAETLTGVEAEIQRLSQRVEHLAATGPDPTAVRYLETAIGQLRELSQRVASGETLAALAQEVRTLAEKVDGLVAAPPADTVASLERRIEGLAQVLNARADQSAFAALPDLEGAIQGIADKLERIEHLRGDHAGLARLEAQVLNLAEKLDAAQAQLASIESIERSLADLFLHVEDTRVSAVQAAEQAAELARQAGPMSTHVVDELRRDLTDLSASQRERDAHTRRMLESLHAAVERLIARLGAIEAEMRAPAAARGSPFQQAAPSRAEAQPLGLFARAEQGASPGGATARPTAAPDPLARFPDLPADHPLEPGSGAPRARASALEAASERPGKPLPDTGEKANFIAAARRAAQAAAAEAAARARRSEDKEPHESGEGGGGAGKRRLPFVLGAAALVVVVGGALAAGWMRPAAPTQTERARAAVPGSAATSQRAAPAVTPAGSASTQEAPAAKASDQTPAPNALIVSPREGEAAPPRETARASDAMAGRPVAPPLPLAGLGQPFDLTGSIQHGSLPLALSPQLPAALAATPSSPSALKPPPAIGGPALQSAALAGDPAAAYEVATRLAEGRGVPVNLEDAVRWFERAAERGLAPAQYRLASLYEKGQGVKRDREKARQLYLAAATKGNAKAMHNLAVLYAEGIDGKPDYRTAAEWFRQAAKHGVGDSQYNLGILYARGIGVEQDLAESYKWFALAAGQGDQEAARKRDEVASRLDPQSLKSAQMAVQSFTPQPQPEEAVIVRAPRGGWDPPTSTPAKRKREG